MNQALATAVKLAKTFEGFSPTPYLCPAGIPTIGCGSTAYRGGRKVTMQDGPITGQEAELLLILTLRRCMDSALKASPSLQGNRLAAITDFVYNLGAGRYRASTLRKRIDEGDWEGAKTEIKRWTRGGGRVLPGLVRRREAEAALLTS